VTRRRCALGHAAITAFVRDEFDTVDRFNQNRQEAIEAQDLHQIYLSFSVVNFRRAF
jgi:hypothetical protein